MTVAAVVLAVVGVWIAVAMLVAMAFGRATAIAKRRAPSATVRRPVATRTPSGMRHLVAVVTGQIPIIRAHSPLS